MAKLSRVTEADAKSIVGQILTAAGVKVNGIGISTISPSDAEPIVHEIVYRTFTFFRESLDKHINNISATIDGNFGDWAIAEAIAWFCSTQGLVWNDAMRTPEEMDAIKDTILGRYLYNFGCFTSSPEPLLQADTTQSDQSQPAAQTSATTQTATPASTPVAPSKKAPATSYKSMGPQSGNIPNLVGTPSAKTRLNGPVFCIEADKKGTNVPNAYITPLKVYPGSTHTHQVPKSMAMTVCMGSGNGYTDCKLWFDTSAAADALLFTLNRRPSMYKNLRVVKYDKADKNGYFEVEIIGGTGKAYIKASKLNECLSHIKENSSHPTNENFGITDIDLYDEWMHRSNS